MSTTDVSLAPSRRNATGKGVTLSGHSAQGDDLVGSDGPNLKAASIPVAASLPYRVAVAAARAALAPGRAGWGISSANRARAPPIV